MADTANEKKEESDDDKKRKERIQQVLEGIRNERTLKKRKLPATATCTSQMSEQMENQGERYQAQKKPGRHREHKVHFGWLHYSKGAFKQVKCRQGGGTRTIQYPIEESQTVESLLLLGTKLFFPEGKSQLGRLEEMTIHLSQFDGSVINNFKDRNGEACTYQDFLKSNGLYASQHYLYIKTKHINENVVTDRQDDISPESASNSGISQSIYQNESDKPNTSENGTLLVNGHFPEKVLIRYTRNCLSVYSGHSSSLNTYSMRDCEMLCNQELEDINYIFQEFSVCSIQVGSVVYLDTGNDNSVTFPQRQETTCGDFILHGPIEIFGTEDGGKSIIIGVVVREHNKGKCNYTWLNSHNVFAAGTDQCLVRITEPGVYNVNIEYDGNVYSFDEPIIVTRISPDSEDYSEMPVTNPTAETLIVSGETQTSTEKEEPKSKKICMEEINHLHMEFNEFKLLDKIGEGGFGEVFHGEYHGTPVAIKKMKVKRLKLVKQSLLKEVQINSHIRHPNIVLLMGYSIEADFIYLLTELIQGPNLDDALFGETGHKMSHTQKHSVASQVCRAVAYLHNRIPIIIHRDIKPENVLLSRNYETAKLCDMGLSKMKTLNTMHSTILQKNDIQPGTPAYQAPEVLMELQAAKPPSDIWSMCSTFVELYTETTIWNLDDTYGASGGDEVGGTIKLLIGFMKHATIPHGLVHLNSQHDVPQDIRDVIKEGLQYKMSMRPTALNICSVLSQK